MSTVKAKVCWIKNFELEGHTNSGHTVKMDTGEHAIAASPAELLLQSLAGCSMMDCVLIISKSRKNFKNFWVDVEAEEAETYPRVYKKIHLSYNFISNELGDAVIERAIKLSHEKYCKVYAMLHNSVDITYSINLNNSNQTLAKSAHEYC